jgi:hypothetical protein
VGIAGKDSSWILEFGQRLRIASLHRIPFLFIRMVALVALAGRLVTGRVLAVQQQRFDA